MPIEERLVTNDTGEEIKHDDSHASRMKPPVRTLKPSTHFDLKNAIDSSGDDFESGHSPNVRLNC
jgi:hypothetical protein